MPRVPRWLFWAVKNTARHFGCDIVPYDASNHWYRFAHLLKHHDVDCYLDVGANVGQHGQYIRNIGFAGRIISFEPVNHLYQRVLAAAHGDALWEAHNCGLGDADTTAEIHLMEDSLYNSLLPPTELYQEAQVVGKETIQVHKLDTLFPQLVKPHERAFLKIDAQGFEERILQGAQQTLKQVVGVVVECSLRAGYSGEMLYRDMDELITKSGFELQSLAPHTGNHETGQLYQFDAVYYRAA